MTRRTCPAEAPGARRRTIVIGAALCCIGLPPLFVLVNAASSYSVNRTNGTIVTSAGQTREYILYVPKSYDRTKPAPLVISMHGAMNSPSFQMQVSQWNTTADENGFIVVYPAGSGTGPKTYFNDGWRTPSRIAAALSGVLGALALLLASIGVYGVVSYGVSQRIREIGIRMTLGANGREVMTLLLRQAMRPVVIGALIGIVGCAAVSQVLSKVLYGIGSHDPIAFIGVPAFLLGVALLASYIPARRATRVDPVVALRYE